MFISRRFWSIDTRGLLRCDRESSSSEGAGEGVEIAVISANLHGIYVSRDSTRKEEEVKELEGRTVE
jgi:hypothetical protein